MKKKFSIFLLLAIGYLLLVSAVQALSPTPEPSPRGEEILGNKIKEIREAVKEKVKEKIDQINKKKAKGYVGEIINLIESAFFMETRQGEINVQVASQAAILGKGGKKLTIKDLQAGNYCIVMGYQLENSVFEARRIVVVNKPQKIAREIAFGKVTDISAEEKILKVKNDKKGLTYMVVANEKTMITKKTDDKVTKVNFSDIALGDRLVAIGTVTENEEKVITAKIIHVIPGLSKPTTTPKPTATLKPTVTIKPTISPKPSASPTPTE